MPNLFFSQTQHIKSIKISFCVNNFEILFITTETFEDAKEYAAKFRAKTPPHYNVRRQFAQPVPALNSTPTTSGNNQYSSSGSDDDDENDSTTFDDGHHTDSNDHDDSESHFDHEHSNTNESTANDTQSTTPRQINSNANNVSESGDLEYSGDSESIGGNNDIEETIENDPSQREQSSVNENTFNAQNERASNDTTTTIARETNGRESVSLIDNEFDELHPEHSNDNDASTVNEPAPQSSAENEIDTKIVLATVEMNKEDENAIAHLIIDDENTCVESDENNTDSNWMDGLILEHNEKAEVKDGKVLVTKTIDSNLEMVYVYGEQPKPLPALYTVKINDVISGNLPFRENVSI